MKPKEALTMNGNINHRIFSFLFLLSSLLLLPSCSGDGGDKDAIAVAGADGGALKGRIRIQDSEEELVLSDRHYHEIPAVGRWLKEQEAGGKKSKPFGRFSADGRYMLQIQPFDCEKGDDSTGAYCFTVFDETYSILGRFTKNIGYYYQDDIQKDARLTGAALSPDGQYVAITRYIPSAGKWRLVMWTSTGERVSVHQTSKIKRMGQPAWLADGSLVLSMDNLIARTDPYSTLVTSTIKAFPADEETRPKYISVSHDGKQLAFLRGHHELWAMGLDGSNLRQVVKLSASSDYWTLAPGGAWSPDDAWIAFRVTMPFAPTGTPAVPLGETRSLLLAVPSNTTNAIATTTTSLSERSPEVIPIQSYNEYGYLSDVFFSSYNNVKHLIWIPE